MGAYPARSSEVIPTQGDRLLARSLGGLRVFLEDPYVPLDNNATERVLRGVVVGRKNHYGSRSVRGTEVAAIAYSLVESAKLNDLAPQAYIAAAVYGIELGMPVERLLPLRHLWA